MCYNRPGNEEDGGEPTRDTDDILHFATNRADPEQTLGLPIVTKQALGRIKCPMNMIEGYG